MTRANSEKLNSMRGWRLDAPGGAQEVDDYAANKVAYAAGLVDAGESSSSALSRSVLPHSGHVVGRVSLFQ